MIVRNLDWAKLTEISWVKKHLLFNDSDDLLTQVALEIDHLHPL